MRSILVFISAGILCACATSPTVDGTLRHETVRLERDFGVLSLLAGGYGDGSGFNFAISYASTKTEMGRPTGVSWTVEFKDYCRNRPSWVQSVLTGPNGQEWRGYRVAVPAGSARKQSWTSGADGMDRYGGPSTPGLMAAIELGGQFQLALEDDTGLRHHVLVINTLTPSEREALFELVPPDDRVNRPASFVSPPAEVGALPPPLVRCPNA